MISVNSVLPKRPKRVEPSGNCHERNDKVTETLPLRLPRPAPTGFPLYEHCTELDCSSRHSALLGFNWPRNAAPPGVLAAPELSLCLCWSPGAGILSGTKASSPSPTQTDRLDWPQESPSTCPTARPVTPAVCSGPAAFTRSSGNHPHKDALCLCAWRQAASRRHGTRAEQRECPGAKSPGPHAQPIFHEKAIPLFPGLNMGTPSAAHNAHPHRNEPLGAGAPDRGAQAARQKFALSPSGGAKHPSA